LKLEALSQACRNLRRFLRPYVWGRIEVFTEVRVSSGETLDTEQQLALELIRQLEIVAIRNPSLSYVKYVESPIWLELLKNAFLPTSGM
jgi:hypothetical protein